jgi:hypothetical protein
LSLEDTSWVGSLSLDSSGPNHAVYIVDDRCLVQVKEEVAFAGPDSVISIWSTCEACSTRPSGDWVGGLALSVSVFVLLS